MINNLIHEVPRFILASIMFGVVTTFYADFVAMVERTPPAILTMLASNTVTAIGLVVGAWIGWARIRSNQQALAMQLQDAERQRAHDAQQAEMSRRERMHDFAGKLNLANLQIEEYKIQVALLRGSMGDMKERMAGQDLTIAKNKTSIQQIQQNAERSGELPTFRPDTQDLGEADPPETGEFPEIP